MPADHSPLARPASWSFAIVMVSAIVATVVLAVDVLMLLFLGLLLGVFLCQCSTMLGRVTPWHYAINLGGITVLLLSIAMGTLFGLGVSLDNQFDKASANLDSSVEKIEKWLKSRPTVFDMVKKVPFSNELFSKEFVNDPLEQAETTETAPGSEREWNGRGERSKSEDSIDADPLQIKKTAESAIRTAGGRVIQTVRKMMGTTFGLLANVGIIFFVGIFLASDPVLYRDGFAKLFPIQR